MCDLFNKIPANTVLFTISSEIDIFEVIQHLDHILSDVGRKTISEVIQLITKPFSILVEEVYIDKSYRDTYYNHFSNKHFHMERNCKRLSFFKGLIEPDDFYSVEGHIKLQEAFIGCMVIKPMNIGNIGRTLLDPKN